MRSESAQASIEYVGVLLLVAALVGGIVGAFGAPTLATRIAASVVRAVVDAIGQSDDHGIVRPSASEQGMFDSAVDPKLPPDDRPSLRDVRLLLIAQHGDELGRRLYSELVLDNVRKAVPELGRPTRFATAGPDVVVPRVPPNLQRIDVEHSLSAPAEGDAGEIETPTGTPNIHVVTVSDADEAFRAALNPGVSTVGVASDVIGALPFAGTAEHAGRLAVAAEKLAEQGGKLAGWTAVGIDLEGLYSAGEASIPAGSREGDEVVSWIATRRPAGGGAARRFERTAVVRDGVVMHQGIRPIDPGSSP
jgi:hypothetical protein